MDIITSALSALIVSTILGGVMFYLNTRETLASLKNDLDIIKSKQTNDYQKFEEFKYDSSIVEKNDRDRLLLLENTLRHVEKSFEDFLSYYKEDSKEIKTTLNQQTNALTRLDTNMESFKSRFNNK